MRQRIVRNLNSVVPHFLSSLQAQRSSQLISHSPVGMVENKMLPINFQMVTQPVQAQNIPASPAAERTARQRYAQILPKPSATSAITLRSPSTMIISNSPIKTVMTTCHVSPVSLVKMTAISLAPNSSNTTTSLTNTSLRAASAGISSSAIAEEISPKQSMRSTSAVPILAPVARPGQAVNQHTTDVEMEVEAIHKKSQMQNPSSLILTQEAMANRARGAIQRAASVPIPHSRDFQSLDETSSIIYNGKSSSNTNTVEAVETSNNSGSNASTLQSPSTQNTRAVTFLNTSRTPSFEKRGSFTSSKEGFLSTKYLRKRSGLSPDLLPVKKVFMPQQAVDGAAVLGHRLRNTAGNLQRQGAPARPESAPASREVETKMNSVLSTHIHTPGTSSFRASGFHSVAKTQSLMQRKNTSSVMETSTSVSHALIQQQQAHMMDNVHAINNPGLQKHSLAGDGLSSNPATGSLEGAQQQTYTQSNPSTEHNFFNETSSASQLPMHTDADYFPFDDDVTQDSIVEELVQMEEQMKLNLHKFGSCVTVQGQQAMMPDNIMATSQTMTSFYHAANSHSNPIHTPTPTPTPTSEMMGGTQGITRESPCSRFASTTPVDSALGSSRHTPVGTPHSNCSSNVPPSPVECRNPFAFTPINSSVTGLHDGSTVSSSPVKPMQRPMATHPDKTQLEWMNNSYNNSSGSLNKTNSGMGILPSYQGLIGDHFQKPHAFAVRHARHQDSHFGCSTPISPVQQQQVASMANMTKQEGFAVPAPLDNKATNTPSATSRCRSVSPAVHQRNLGGNTGSFSYIPRSVVSPFNSPVTPEVLNIFANSQSNLGVSNMTQRSHSVPLNIMMQTEVPSTPGHQCNSDNMTNVLLSKLDGDQDETVRGLGINNLPSSYTARMNLTQILESDPNLSCSDNHLGLMSSDFSSSCKLQRSNYFENAINEQMTVSAGDNLVLSASGEQQQQHAQSVMLPLSSEQLCEELKQHHQLDFSSTMRDLLIDSNLTAGNPLMEQSELTTGETNVSCEIRMKSELPSSISDLNTLETNLLFDPNQQGHYQNEELNDPLFQQITSEVAHSSGNDWLESKDHPTVGLMG